MEGHTTCYIAAHCGTASLASRLVNLVSNRRTAAIVTMASLIGGIYIPFQIVGACNASRHAATSGVLHPERGQPSLVPALLIGGVKFFFQSPDGAAIVDHGQPIIRLKLDKERGLLVSGKFRSEDKKLTAQLEDNEWSNQSKPGIFDRNYTSSALEVLDPQGNVSVQVINFGSAIYVAGVFRCENGGAVVAAPAGDGGATMQFVPPGTSAKPDIPLLCRYPSEEHLGLCPGAEKFRPPSGVVTRGYRFSKGMEVCAQFDKPPAPAHDSPS